MTEEDIRKIVAEAIEEELTREGGALDQCREAALEFCLAAINVKFRNFEETLRIHMMPEEGGTIN